MILFDSDSFIELMRRNAEIVNLVNDIGINSIYINPIVKAEIQFKAINKRDLAVIDSKLDLYPSIPLDDDISDKFSALFEKYLLSHRPVQQIC